MVVKMWWLLEELITSPHLVTVVSCYGSGRVSCLGCRLIRDATEIPERLLGFGSLFMKDAAEIIWPGVSV